MGPIVTAYGSHLRVNKGDDEEDEGAQNTREVKTQQICSRESKALKIREKFVTSRKKYSITSIVNQLETWEIGFPN